MKASLGKRIFLAFFAFVALVIYLAVKYVESPHFASLIQDRIAERIESELGISLQFKNLTVSAFPPGIAVNEAKLANIEKDNKLGIDVDTVFMAERVGIALRMFQTFSHELVVNRFFLEGAKIQYKLESKEGKKSTPITREALEFLSRPIQIQLQSGISLDIRQVELRQSTIDIRVEKEDTTDVFFIENIKFFALRPEGDHYSSIVDLQNIAIRQGDSVYDLELFNANFQVGADKIQITALDMKKDDAVIHAGGVLDGEIRFPDKLSANLRVVARAKTSTIKRYVDGLDPMTGSVNAELNVIGDLNSYKISGKFEGNDFGYNLWSGLNLSSVLELTRSRLKLQNLKVTKNGGEINFDPIDIDLNIYGKEIILNPKFTNANFQDFCGDLKTDISNLEAIMNGSVEVAISINDKGQKPTVDGLRFLSKLDLSKVQLTNQTWGKDRPRKVIFEIPRVKLEGKYTWAPFRFKVVEGILGLSTGDLVLSGHVDADTGWSLRGVGEKIDIGVDLGSVSGAPLAGVGGLGVYVQGTPDNIFFHFDMDMQNARYINLNLGEVKGRVSIDDDKSKVLFQNLKGVKEQGYYIANGEVDISDEEKLNFDVEFKDADIDGVLDLFRYQLKDVAWTPYGIRGVMSGRYTVRGTYKDPEDTMDIRGRFTASRILYSGEIVNKVTGLLGLSRGKYFAKDVKAEKYSSFITGEVEYSRLDGIQYEFDWLRGRLRDLDIVSRTGIPLNANIVASGWGKGEIDSFTSKLEITVENGHVGSMPLPGVLMRLDSDATFWDSILMIGESGNGVRVQQARTNNANSNIEMSFDSQDFGFLICMLNGDYCSADSTRLVLSGGMKGQWKGANWKALSGQFALSDARLFARDFQLRAVDPIRSDFVAGKAEKVSFHAIGENTELKGDFGFDLKEPYLTYKTEGRSSLKWMKILTPLISRSTGSAAISVGGTLRKDRINLNGSVRISEGSIVLRGMRPGIDGLQGVVSFINNRLVVDRLEGVLGQGRVSLDGYVLFRPDDFPLMNIGMNFRDNKIKFYPVNVAEVEEGRLTFAGDSPPYLLSGKVLLRGLLMKRSFDMDSGQQSIKSAKYLPSKSFGKSNIYSINIEAEAPKGVVVSNDILDAEFSGRLTLLNSFEFPQVIGRAELVKGKLLFRNTPFELDHAIVRSTNPLEFDPWFSIGGNALLDSYRVTIFASGNASDPKISLGSSPPLPQEEILSLLAFGYIDRPEGQVNPDDLNTITYTEVSSLLLDQLRLNKDLQSRGLSVRVAPKVIQNEANIVRPRAEADSAVPKIIIQTQVVEDIDASLGTTVGSSQSQQFDLNVEYHLSDKVSIQSVYEQEPGTEAGETRTSFGADLKFKWGFK